MSFVNIGKFCDCLYRHAIPWQRRMPIWYP